MTPISSLLYISLFIVITVTIFNFFDAAPSAASITDERAVPRQTALKSDEGIWGTYPNEPLQAITPAAVHQGELGDCYFIAPLASLAKMNPEAIKDLIQENGDGTFTVTFPADEQHPVTVNAPSEAELIKFARKDDNYGTWVNLIEKAHRQYTGRDNYDKGDDAAAGLALLSPPGAKIMHYRLGNTFTNERKLVFDLKRAVSAKKMIVISTDKPDHDYDPRPYRVNHVFAVIGFDAKARKLKIRDSGFVNDPWGEPKVAGCFDLSLDDLYTHFKDLKSVR